MLSVGPRLKALRKERGLKLAQVAAAVGVSASFLSQLERDKVGASFSTMMKLARFYDINLAELLEYMTRNENATVSRPGERTRISGNGFVLEWLVNDPHCAMEVDILSIQPGGESGESYSHEGEEYAYVLEGSVVISVGGEEYRLSQGDLIYFKSSRLHSWRNEGRTSARVMFCTTPPTV